MFDLSPEDQNQIGALMDALPPAVMEQLNAVMPAAHEAAAHMGPTGRATIGFWAMIVAAYQLGRDGQIAENLLDPIKAAAMRKDDERENALRWWNDHSAGAELPQEVLMVLLAAGYITRRGSEPWCLTRKGRQALKGLVHSATNGVP